MRKTRLRRRDASKERHWREVIRGQGVSGQSVRAYCRGAGVKESAFYWWRRELARRDAEQARDRRNAGNGASRNKASHNGASRNKASHNGASRNKASHNGASRNKASHNGASSNKASDNGASLDGLAHRGSPPLGVAPARKTSSRRSGGRAPARKRSARPSDGDRPRFLPVHVEADGPLGGAKVPAVVEIHLGDGRMIRVGPGVERRTLLEVLAALEGSSC